MNHLISLVLIPCYIYVQELVYVLSAVQQWSRLVQLGSQTDRNNLPVIKLELVFILKYCWARDNNTFRRFHDLKHCQNTDNSKQYRPKNIVLHLCSFENIILFDFSSMNLKVTTGKSVCHFFSFLLLTAKPQHCVKKVRF